MNIIKKINDVLIDSQKSIRDVMRFLNKGTYGFYLVTDENRKLLGTITDGDIRRSILKGVSLDNSVLKCMNKKPKVIFFKDINKYKQKLQRIENKKFLPVINKDYKILSIIIEEDKSEEKTALIMAGGFGKRLGNKTKLLPKPLLKVRKKPILEHILIKLEEAKYTEIYISTHYLHSKIKDYIKKRNSTSHIKIFYERSPLGTAGSISFLKQKDFKTITVVNADIIFDVNLDTLHNYHRENFNDITLTVAKYQYKIPYGVIHFDKRLQYKSLLEKPVRQEYILSGMYCLNKNICDLVDTKFTNMTDLISTAYKLGKKISIFPLHEYWNDIGEPLNFKQEILRSKK